MAQEGVQTSVRSDGRLASVSRWVTRSPVIPLLTALSFVASTVFAYILLEDQGHGFYGMREALPMAIGSLILGIGLGPFLRRAMMRIRDAGPSRPDIGILARVGLAWILAFLVQSFVFFVMVASF